MPKKTNATQPETKTVEAETKTTEPETTTPEAARGTKTTAIKAALKANPKKQPKEIVELLNAEGWDIKAQLVSVVKFAMKTAKKKAKAAPAPAPEAAAARAVPADAVSLAALQKAKKLIQELGGVANAKQALNALGQLLD